jgi:hypothetical protein
MTKKTAPARHVTLAEWQALVAEAIATDDAAQVEQLIASSRCWDLPIDLAYSATDAAEMRTIAAGTLVLLGALERRISELPAASRLAFELCCLRDVLGDS